MHVKSQLLPLLQPACPINTDTEVQAVISAVHYDTLVKQGCYKEGDRLTNVQINHGRCPVGPDSIVQQQSAECTFANISGPNNLHSIYSVPIH